MPKGHDNSSDLLADVVPQLSPEMELGLNLEMARQHFENDKSTALHAFQAIGYLVVHHWQLEECNQPDEITVPYWVINALGIGWMKYREAFSEGRTTTLGEVYAVEGGGQGKSKKVRSLDQDIRDIRVATKIAFEVSNGATVTSAISELANFLGVSEETIGRIWKKLGKTAKQVIKRSGIGQNLEKS